jgi:MinD superfamily P-loop ATPase
MAKHIVILSGKGGTGKTTLSAAFCYLAENKVAADCDVDAADLYILLKPEKIEAAPFYGSKKAVILADKCAKCGLCEDYCRFGAIKNFSVDIVSCEGCGFCYRICPSKAIMFDYYQTGEKFDGALPDDSKFLYAKLAPGEGNSGKLVTDIKKHAGEYSENAEYIIVDGPPGIGCPVNASIANADIVVLVTEPTVSGIHDLQRILQLLDLLNKKAAVVINKFDINLSKTEELKKFLSDRNTDLLGEIPYDASVVKALQQSKSILEYKESIAAQEIIKLWSKLELKLITKTLNEQAL